MKKFIRYGIGEVLLIVIGVLIAVSIDNWNEDRNQKKQLNRMLDLLRNDMIADTIQVNDIQSFYAVRLPIFNEIMRGEFTKEDYSSCANCDYLITGHRLFYPNTKGVEILQEYLKLGETEEDLKLVQFLQTYSVLLGDLELVRSNIIEDVNANVVEWRNEYPWFADFIKDGKNPGYLSYKSQNPDYRNKLAYHYVMVYDNYLPILNRFQEMVKTFLEE